MPNHYRAAVVFIYNYIFYNYILHSTIFMYTFTPSTVFESHNLYSGVMI